MTYIPHQTVLISVKRIPCEHREHHRFARSASAGPLLLQQTTSSWRVSRHAATAVRCAVPWQEAG